MTHRMCQQIGTIANLFSSCRIANNANTTKFLKFTIPQIQASRDLNFYTRKPLSELWKSATTVSNPGKKRGRGKNTMMKVNIRKIIKIPPTLEAPGLTVPLRRGDTYLSLRKLDKSVIDNQESAIVHDKTQKQHVAEKDKDIVRVVPLRGWSSTTVKGKNLGPPNPPELFEGFGSWVLFTKTRTIMHPNLGRVKKYFALTVVGNGNGTAGFAETTGQGHWQTINKTRQLASQRLITINRYENRTVMHDFYAQFGKAKIIVKQMPQGYGLVCHRVIKAMCEAFGIKDLYAKSEGSDNIRTITYAFFVGLFKQKTHQQLAADKKLHLVQLNSENYYFPRVLASPETVRKPEEIQQDEPMDLSQHVFGGKVLYRKKKPEPFFTKLKSYDRHLRKVERRRGQLEVSRRLKAEYGHLRSFLTDEYPEAKMTRFFKKKDAEDVLQE